MYVKLNILSIKLNLSLSIPSILSFIFIYLGKCRFLLCLHTPAVSVDRKTVFSYMTLVPYLLSSSCMFPHGLTIWTWKNRQITFLYIFCKLICLLQKGTWTIVLFYLYHFLRFQWSYCVYSKLFIVFSNLFYG